MAHTRDPEVAGGSGAALLAPSELPERDAFAADVKAGLGRGEGKEIPSRYLYDPVGSALFETITLLPEYGLTRADERVLRRHAGEIAGAAQPAAAGRTPAITVVELGSGTGRKTRWILEALARRRSVAYNAVDVSASSLERCRIELSGLPRVRVAGLRSPYLEGLRQVAAGRGDRPLLVLFLGSTLGNFPRREAGRFLSQVRGLMREGDLLLLGTDLQQDPRRLGEAYDDPAGVTAAFNRNVLSRINRELGGSFVPRNFDHEARWNEAERRVEMHLVSRLAQEAAVPGAGLTARFRRGETIWTEMSCKFDPAEVRRLARGAGFSCAAQWIDDLWPFAESLLPAD